MVVVSRNNLDKMLSKSAVNKSESPAIHAMAVANADRLFERAVYGWSKPDRDEDIHFAGIHRFFAPMWVDGRMKLVKLTVKETVGEETANPLYTVEAVDFDDTAGGWEWMETIAREDGVSLDKKMLPQRGEWVVQGNLVQDAPPRNLTPRGGTVQDSTKLTAGAVLPSLAQPIEQHNQNISDTKNPPGEA